MEDASSKYQAINIAKEIVSTIILNKVSTNFEIDLITKKNEKNRIHARTKTITTYESNDCFLFLSNISSG